MDNHREYCRIAGHFFRVNEHYYGFDEEELIPVSLDYNAYNYLKSLPKKHGILEKERYDDVAALVDSEILFKSYPEEKFKLVDSKEMGRVSFPTVHDCNFRCKYCFASGGENYTCTEKVMTPKMLVNILDFLYYDMFREYQSIRFDFVSGGEPLLSYPVIKELNNLTKSYNRKTGKTSFIWVCTNGSLLNSEITEYFEAEHIGLGISFEGLEKYQNLMRPLKSGGNSYDLVLKNIGDILSSDNLTGFTKKFWTLGVVTARTESIIDLIESYEKLGITNLQLKLCRLPQEKELSIHAANVEHIKELYRDFTCYLKERLANRDINVLFMIMNKNDLFGKYILRLLLRNPMMRRCGAGLNKISLCANGDIYPCDSFVGNPEFYMGNVSGGRIENKNILDETMTIYSSAQCTSCWARFVCGGDCYYNAYIGSGNVEQPLKCFCELYKYLIELAIDLCAYISDLDSVTRRLIEKGATIRNEYF